MDSQLTGCSHTVTLLESAQETRLTGLALATIDVPGEALDFTYTACSGAVVKEITQQAEKLSSDQQFIMLSAVRLLGPKTKRSR
jgi:hypothetical protein